MAREMGLFNYAGLFLQMRYSFGALITPSHRPIQ